MQRTALGKRFRSTWHGNDGTDGNERRHVPLSSNSFTPIRQGTNPTLSVTGQTLTEKQSDRGRRTSDNPDPTANALLGNELDNEAHETGHYPITTTLETNNQEEGSDANADSFPIQLQVAVTKSFNKAMRYIVNWSSLISIISLHSHLHFTASQYLFLSDCIANADNSTSTLETYKTIRNAQRKFLLDNCLPVSKVYYISSNHYRNSRRFQNSRIQTFNAGEHDPRDCVRITLPSEWAKYDVLTLSIYEHLYGNHSLLRSSLSIEKAPLVNCGDRRKYLSGTSVLWAMHNNVLIPCDSGTNLTFNCVAGSERSYHSAPSNDIIKNLPNHRQEFNVRQGPIWCVRNVNQESSNIPMPTNLTAEELLLFYCTSIATNPLSHFCNDADQQRTNNRIDYEHLFTFPADLCVLLRKRNGFSNYLCLLIGSFIWREDGRIGERIIWFSSESFKRRCLAELSKVITLFQPWCSHRQISSLDLFQVDSNGLHSPNLLQFLNDPENSVQIRKILQPLVPTLLVSGWSQVDGTPYVPNNCSPISNPGRKRNGVRNQGILDDGTPYVVYRFTLYSDGFKQKKSLSDNRSVDGCYIMPSGLPHECRCSSISARTITLASYGQDVNEVMNIIVEDIINGSTDGIDSIDPYGRKIKIFLDAFAIIGDYPAISSNSDVSGHSSDAFCSYCVTRKRKGTNLPEVVFSCSLHSRRLSLMRFDERMRILRSSGVPKHIKKHLGTSCSSEEESCSLVTVNLANALTRRQDNVRSDKDNNAVVDTFFDSHQSSAAVPDHIFKNIIVNVLKVCFNYLENDMQRKSIDVLICQAIYDNNLPSIDSVLRWDKHGKYQGLNNLSTSGLFCVSLFAAPIFLMMDRTGNSPYTMVNVQPVSPLPALSANAIPSSNTANAHTRRNDPYGDDNDSSESENDPATSPFHLVQWLQDIVCLVYWWPRETFDSKDDVNFVLGKEDTRPLKYFAAIQEKVRKYIRGIIEYYENNGRDREILDKPNAHRLLELAVHTIPMYGHALNVSELVLEQVHRRFKEWLEKNTHDDAHITAVEISLIRDWFQRLYCTYKIWTQGSDDERTMSEIGLKRFLLGANAMEHIGEDLMNRFRTSTRNAFRKPVLDEMRGSTRSSFLRKESERWKAHDRINGELLTSKNILREGTSVLNAFFRRSGNVNKQFHCYAIANYERKDQFSTFRSTNVFNNIRLHDFISAKVEGGDSTIWLIVKKLDILHKNIVFVSEGARIQCMRLESGVRRLGKMIINRNPLSNNCEREISQRRVRHSRIVVESTTDTIQYWCMFTAKEGFPPHLA